MAAVITNRQVEGCLRDCLRREGFELTQSKGNGETGVDLIATKGRRHAYIEVIGFRSQPPTRSRDFFEIFFRAISRLEDGAKEIVVALPARFGEGLPSRAKHYGEAWRRIGAAFPELRIWLVNPKENTYRETKWSDWLS
jgi:hypothetical protein